MSDYTAFMTMQAADLAQAQTIYNQMTETTEEKQQSEQWVMMTDTQTKVFVIDTTAPSKPTAWVAPSLINTTTRVPLGFTAQQALRLRWMLNHLP